MIRRFVKLGHRSPGMRALFKDEKLMLLLPHNGDLFEPSLLLHARSTYQLDLFVRTIDSLLSVVNELDLNTRIWSKA